MIKTEKKKKMNNKNKETKMALKKKLKKEQKKKPKKVQPKTHKIRKRTGVMRTILLIAILPLLLSSIIITARSLSTLKKTMVSAEKSRLKGICYTVMKAYDEKAVGIYSMEEGMFFKGTLAISNNNQFLDYTKLATGTDLAMFYGDECQLTTYLYKDNNKNRALDIELPEAAKKKVLEEGKDYFAEDVKYCGVHYYGYFAPLINNADTTEDVVGVFFAGTPREEVDKEITAALRNQVILAVLFIVVAGVAASVIAMGLARSLKKSIVSLESLSDGNLAFDIDKKVLKRKDEIGQIGVSVGTLRDSLQEIIGNMKGAADELVDAVETLNETAGQTSETMEGVTRAIGDISQGAVSQAEDTQGAYANVTRMDPQKNHLYAVDVFREIHKIEPKSIFLYGGVIPKISPTVDVVEAKIDEYGLTDYCRFTGPVMDVEQLYHLTDLWIYCSSYEGLPFGPIELQAASVPVIASDVITKEIDLGLGLIHFLSLADGPEKWAELAMHTNKEQLPKTAIVDAFNMHHFDIRQGVRRLEDIYNGSL